MTQKPQKPQNPEHKMPEKKRSWFALIWYVITFIRDKFFAKKKATKAEALKREEEDNQKFEKTVERFHDKSKKIDREYDKKKKADTEDRLNSMF